MAEGVPRPQLMESRMQGMLTEGFMVHDPRYPYVKSQKFNNPYKIDSNKAIEIWNLPNEELVKRVNTEYQNIEVNDKRKKNDPEILKLAADEKELKEAIANHPNMLKLLEKQEEERKNLEVMDPEINQYLNELTSVKSQLSNERSEYQRDAREFKGLFKLCMDEIKYRIDNGTLEG